MQLLNDLLLIYLNITIEDDCDSENDRITIYFNCLIFLFFTLVVWIFDYCYYC